MYADGRGVPRDGVQALMWTSIACSRAGIDLKQQCVRAENKAAKGLSNEQRAEALRLAQEWKPKSSEELGTNRAQGTPTPPPASEQQIAGRAVFDDNSSMEFYTFNQSTITLYRNASGQNFFMTVDNASGQKTGKPIVETRKAADQGDPDAEFNLGYMYFQGQGVQQDYAEAARWFRKAAEQGDARAQFGLSVLYDQGQGVSQNHAEAVRWFSNATKHSQAGASVQPIHP